MRVVFWGASGGCGTTSNMAAVAGYLAFSGNCRSICLQPKEGKGDLESFFMPGEERPVLNEEGAYHVPEGMDYLIWQEQHHALNGGAVAQSLVPVPGGELYYLPGGAREKPGLYPVRTCGLQRRILDSMEKYADIVFIDAGDCREGFAYSLLEDADVAVVNLYGGQRELEGFFGMPRRRGREVYLLSNYSGDWQRDSRCLRRVYRIDGSGICPIPPDLDFARACAGGHLGRYLKKNCLGNGAHREGSFFSSLRYAANRIMEAAAS